MLVRGPLPRRVTFQARISGSIEMAILDKHEAILKSFIHAEPVILLSVRAGLRVKQSLVLW